MQPFLQPFPDLDRLKQAWTQFTTTGVLAADLSPLVTQSWQRCAPRLNPHSPPRWSALNDDVLALTLRQRRNLLALARPILEDVYQFLETSGVMLALVDSTTCLLDYVGDAPMIELMMQLGIRRGVFLHEGGLGTIAFSSALLDSSPAAITGAEHFLSYFHGLSTVAAPIFALDGHAQGAVGLLTTADRYSPYAIGMVVAAARAIENQLHAEALTAEANARASELYATLDASSDAVLVWDAEGRISHLNEQAAKLLGLRPATVMGRPLSDHLTLPEVLARAAANGEEVTEAEVTFALAEGSRACLASLRFSRPQPDGAPINYILTLRQIERVHQLVHRLVGAQARRTLDDLVSQSTATKRVRRQALAAADAKACVLILGEAGTGKNVLARAIHNSSRRAEGPFLAVNCRAVPRDLVLGEFLGYEAGAFNMPTGQPSKFELAHGGTLFLDEVDALPLDMQAALLRIIEAGDVIRLGGKRVIPVDVRIIAASHHSLEERVAEGSFRSDLLFRLSSFVITLPPLRERTEDIPLLIDRILERLTAQIGFVVRLLPETREALLAYPWPGNIRELESVLERAALACDGEPISPAHLPMAIRERRYIRQGKTSPLTEPVRSMVEAEKLAIISAFRATNGNMTKAAAVLGIGRTTLWRKLKEHRLSTDDLIT
ncbi:MAG: dihydroxyacetone kinase operon transcriptional regulator DhaR [Anaerolineales bacterium]|nr:dihydroxyacetone kinase operon transcriptional regulator DhaR [Anaerolineales bacterium]